MNDIILKLGTRASPLAMAQSGHVAEALQAAWPIGVALEPIRTSGDVIQDQALRDAGGKGLFTKEIDQALLDGRVAFSVNSLKDVPAALPDGLILSCVPEREDPRDVLISTSGGALDDLPDGAVFGSASLRRVAQAKAKRPDLSVTLLRGNVETRLAKVRAGTVHATMLAAAGLNRLGMTPPEARPLETDVLLPALGQGCLGLVCRADDTATRDYLAALDHAPSHAAALAERAFMRMLDGDCRTPMAGLATVDGETMTFTGAVFDPEGGRTVRVSLKGQAADAEALGGEAARHVMVEAGPAFLQAIRHA